MNNPLTMIPALYRKFLYLLWFLVGVVFGAIQIAYASLPDVGQPTWLTVALVVYAYVGATLNLTAASNVNSADTPKPAPGNDALI